MIASRIAAGSLAALGLSLAACAQTPPPADDTPVMGGGGGYKCDAAPLANLVGQQASEALGRDALQRSNSRSLRWIGPNNAVTMDYREDRLNVKMDAKNMVTGFSCG